MRPAVAVAAVAAVLSLALAPAVPAQDAAPPPGKLGYFTDGGRKIALAGP